MRLSVIKIVCTSRGTAGTATNDLDLYSGCAQLESRPEHRLYIRGFPQALQEYTGTIPWLRHVRTLPDPFNSSVILPPTLYRLDTDRHLLSRWYLAPLILRPWRWMWHVPPKRRLAFNRLHGVISQNIVLFSVPQDRAQYKQVTQEINAIQIGLVLTL
jgi:hypothetical protein